MKKNVLAVMAALVLCACPSYAKKEKKTAEVTFEVSMHCKKCADKITENVGFEKGVLDLKVDMAEKTVYVKYNPDKTNLDTLKKAIEKLGYSAEVKNASTECAEKSCCKKENAESKGTCCKKDTANSKCCKKDGCKKDEANSGCCKNSALKEDCHK